MVGRGVNIVKAGARPAVDDDDDDDDDDDGGGDDTSMTRYLQHGT